MSNDNNNSITSDAINQFRNELMAGLAGITKAASIYVQAIDADCSAVWRFRDACNDLVPNSAWSGFEAVGRKALHPRLLLGGGNISAAKRRMLKKLPYSAQEDAFTGAKCKLLLPDGDHMMINFLDTTEKQSAQLFGGDHIRSLQEQKAYLASTVKTIVESVPQEPLPYEIVKNKLIVHRPGMSDLVLTKCNVKRILQAMA